jgi:hypothetical protein
MMERMRSEAEDLGSEGHHRLPASLEARDEVEYGISSSLVRRLNCEALESVDNIYLQERNKYRSTLLFSGNVSFEYYLQGADRTSRTQSSQ